MKTEVIDIEFLSEDGALDKIKRASETIKRGGLVVFPTETVYGLGADATNQEAAKKIYAAKGRPSDNPLIIHIATPQDAEEYAVTNDVYYKLAEHFMPGPLTVILKSKDSIPKETRGGLDTVAVRCPSDEIANALIYYSGVPIAAPSANLSGSPSPTSAKHVMDDMMGRVDVIINGGNSDFGLESTIVKINDDGGVTLLRPGKITVDELFSVCGDVIVADAVTNKLKEGEIAISPGMKYRHYAPKAPLVLLDGTTEEIIAYISSDGNSKKGIISYSEDVTAFCDTIPDAKIYNLGDKADEEAQAHNLFFILREADKENFDVIYAPLPSTDGIGLAIYNRMIRAAAHKIIKL